MFCLRKLPICAIAISAIGCGSIELTPELEQQLPDFPTDHQAATRGILGDVLLDPGSATFQRWTTPRPGYRVWSVLWPSPWCVGWLWEVEINARNSVGGYIGFELFEFLLDEFGTIHWATGHPGVTLRRFREVVAR